jgi:hypothetical protein
MNSGETPTKQGYSGGVPPAAIDALERELTNLEHGAASLTIHVRAGHLARFVIERQQSFLGVGCDG